METDKGKLMGMLRLMHTIRVFEQTAQQLFTEGLARGDFQGALHSYEGEEAIAVGACSCLRKDDYVVSTHRGHGHCIAKGADVARMLAELQGRETGYSRGRGGSMHIFDAERRFMGGYGIVGGNLPLAAGLALASQYREEDTVTVCMFGDGASNTGNFGETMNLAALWDLPIVFLVENNLYGMGTQVTRASAVPDLSRRVSGYGMESAHVDGMDLLAIRALSDDVVAECRAGRGPWFIEAKTYRYRGHSMADPATYRTKDEVEEWRVRDPISIYEKQLLGAGLITDEEIRGISAEIDAVVDESVKFAEESPFPQADALYDHVYASGE